MELLTSRLEIRDLEPGDRPLVEAWRRDPTVVRYLDPRIEAGRPDDWFDLAVARNAEPYRMSHDCAIGLRSTGEVIGWIHLGRTANILAREHVVGYLLRPAFRGRGYATEALVAVLEYGFSVLRASSICAVCYEANPASARVLLRSGLTPAGYVPSYDPSLGPTLRYVIACERWAADHVAARRGAG